MPQPDNVLREEFMEKAAEIEHIRWAKWQNHFHSFLTWNDDIQAWVLPHDKKSHWQSQIETPYSMLTEYEKSMDRKETEDYFKFFASKLHAKEEEIQQDVHSVLAMLDGDTDRVKIANYVRKYLLNPNQETK